jgi:hypothetical protein
MHRTDHSKRVGALVAACAFVAILVAPHAAIALQQRVVGGQALDANLRTDGSGFNTSSPTNRRYGMQSNVYRPAGGAGGSRGLSSAAYSPGRRTSGAVDTRYGTGGLAISTGAGTFTTGAGGGRTDPLRNPQYSVLQTGTLVQKGRIPTSTVTRAPISAPRSTATAYRMGGTTRAPSTGLTSTKYAVARRTR